MPNVSNPVVVITGAGGSLGPAVARAFAESGASLVITDRKQTALDHIVTTLDLHFDRRMAVSVDLLNQDAVRAWADAIAERFGGVDAVLHLVGGYRDTHGIAAIRDEDWALLRQSLVETTLNVGRAFVGALKRSPRGRFAIVSSPQARAPSAGSAAYAMGKAAAEALVLAMADELKGTSATANVVVVNAIVSPQMRAANPHEDYSSFTSADELAETLLFLCSDAARAMNGQRLSVHGLA